jgi:hypothetical protein
MRMQSQAPMVAVTIWQPCAPTTSALADAEQRDSSLSDLPHSEDVVVVADGGDHAHGQLHGARRVQVRATRTCAPGDHSS